MLFILAGWSINDTGRTQELKSRSFIAEITVVQGLVSFNITSVQFGVLQLQRKLLSLVQKLISKLFKLFGIIFIILFILNWTFSLSLQKL